MYFLLNFLIFTAVFCRVESGLFDRYSGKKVEAAQAKELRLKNATERCSIELQSCTPHEGSRIDGTCNNYKYPIRGSARGPYLRLLKPDYANDRDIRMNRHGDHLPSARKVRTVLHSTGRVEDKVTFNMAAVHMLEFIHRDISVMNGPLDYLRRRQYCCTPIGRKDPKCIPIHVPDNDPYLKVTDIRCLNFSRAETFQEAGCTPETVLPEQINFQTPVIDLSTIYGVDNLALSKVRKFKHGLLILEKRENRYVPANITANSTYLSSEMVEEMKTKIITNIKDDMTMKLTMNMINNNYTVANMTSELMTNLSSEMIGHMTKKMPNMLPNETETDDLKQQIMQTVMQNIRSNITTEKDKMANMTADALIDSIATIVADSMVRLVNSLVSIRPNVTENVCFQNNDTETVCYDFGFPEVGNYDLRTTTLTIFFMREHNRLARALHEINPCWKDDRLFKVARQINIATAANIFMYELLPALLGFRNMVNYGILSENVEHVSAYEADAVPLVYAEYDIATRYFHTFLDGRIKTYTESYHYKDEYSYSDTMFRSGLLEKGKILEEINRGTFHQNAAKIDDIQDPEISESYFGKRLQKAHDLPAIGIQRGRDMGIRGYNDYRHLCGMKPAKKFRDFLDVMEIEKVEALKRLYDDVDDVDLLAGVMSENHIQGIYAGPTLFCIMMKQYEVYRYSDRFWFERGDQMHSFSLDQLHEIRKTNMARLACDNAEGIKYIQHQAFMNVKPGNMPVPCSHIDGPDLRRWEDESCHKYSKYSDEAHVGYKMSGGYKKEPKHYMNYKQIPEKYERVSEGYDRAPEGYVRAAEGYNQAPDGYERASEEYERVSEGFKQSPMVYKHKQSYFGNGRDSEFSTFFDNLLSYKPYEEVSSERIEYFSF